jgi:malate synthase
LPHFEAPLDDWRKFTRELFDALYEEEVGLLQEVANIADASDLFREIVGSDEFTEFLTLPAYELLD